MALSEPLLTIDESPENATLLFGSRMPGRAGSIKPRRHGAACLALEWTADPQRWPTIEWEVMEPFTIQVLGGHFTVEKIVPQKGQSEDEASRAMRDISPERWFVVLDEPLDGEPIDALALIDDDLEFQTLATGTFKGES